MYVQKQERKQRKGKQKSKESRCAAHQLARTENMGARVVEVASACAKKEREQCANDNI